MGDLRVICHAMEMGDLTVECYEEGGAMPLCDCSTQREIKSLRMSYAIKSRTSLIIRDIL